MNTKSRLFVDVSRGESKGIALYAFPHAGAGVTAVHKLCVALSDTFDTYGVRLPGRESRLHDPVETVMPVLATKLASELVRHAQGRPVVLYGHCAGTVIAYEVARRLDPCQLRGLAVSSHPAPGSFRREPTWNLPRPEFLRQVETDGYLPPEILANEELLEIYEPAVRADYQLVEDYEHEMYTGGRVERISAPIVAVFSSDDDTLDPAHIDAWKACTAGSFRVWSIATGGHDLPGRQPAELAEAIRRELVIGA